jgi:hypothetical protein
MEVTLKKMKKLCVIAVMLMSLLFSGWPVIAADDHFDFIVDFSGYEEGDIPSGVVAENVSIMTETKDNGETVNYLTSQSDGNKGKWTVNLTNLSNAFEIVIEGDFERGYSGNFTNLILFPVDASHEALKLVMTYGPYFQLNENERISASKITAWKKGLNLFKLKVEGGLAKFYINGKFVQSASIEPNLTYTSLQVEGLSSHERILSVKGKNVMGDGSTPPPTGTTGTTPAPTGDCMATYTVDGRLHIPCVSVPGPFGSLQVYQVDLQQRGAEFVFDLDLNTVKPR